MLRGQQLLLLLFFRGSLINAGEWASARLCPGEGAGTQCPPQDPVHGGVFRSSRLIDSA